MNNIAKANILIVDDVPDNLRLLRDSLQIEGYKVRSCTTGAMALRATSSAPTDLILLDIKLPDCDGYEICRQLKADKKTAHISVIFLSGLNNTFDKIHGFSVGGADYITKPFQVKEVLVRVETHLSIQRLQKSLQEKNLHLTKEIEKHKQTQQALFFEKELAQLTLKSIGDAVITTDAKGNVTSLNARAEYLTGWSEQEAQGLPLFKVFSIINEFTKKNLECPVIKALDEIKTINLGENTLLINRDGKEVAIDDSVAPIQDNQGNVIGAIVVFRDITEMLHYTNKLSWQASHDFLTGLINRSKFEHHLDMALNSVKNEGHHYVLCYLDLDQFKIVNDTCGHVAGDELLRQVSKILQERIRETDVLARLGGDEFAFLLHQCSLEKAMEIAEATRKMIEKFRFSWNNQTFYIGVSIGVVAIDPMMKDKNTVLGIADALCYAAKGEGRNCVQVYRTNDYELARQRRERQWVNRIHQALEENHFCLYSQKVIPVNNKSKPIYYEILLRLLDKEGQIIVPAVFMPSAARYELMPLIDHWVISAFFRKYHDYYHQNCREGHCSPILYALNISGASINSKHFLDFLQQQLEEAQVPPETICFEITENTAISNFDQALKLITRIKQLGCRFAIDDFGHGMNSFDYIKHFPVDYLKIDGSFVRNLVNSDIDRAIVESFNHIGHVMNLQTIAECVENKLILEKLTAIRVDYLQGYEIAKPVPFEFESDN